MSAEEKYGTDIETVVEAFAAADSERDALHMECDALNLLLKETEQARDRYRLAWQSARRRASTVKRDHVDLEEAIDEALDVLVRRGYLEEVPDGA